ncbi:sister chromatid cohesion protein PDS5 homolog A isoform X1 [Ananas comosus]|uniref:Sister chromatid cohesion protein PDS5 homolog A isoform X1 n=2 Tax=Ananas comosus TaxID=4615 RepID=A0A6P5F392_ANACO|nr:sister chromatid cohesion protein PDS5 homolog A isoform X1 [Ananas comosus]
MAQKPQQQLRELGSKLETPPASKDALVKLLKQAANCLSEIEQSPSASVLDSMKPCLNAIAKQELLKHQDRDVKVLVATCICEITRITAPEAPYNDDVLKDIFQLIVGTFSGLRDVNSPSFGRRVVILETLARYRSCVVMLDLECNDLINEMFHTFFTVVSDDHPQNVLNSMQTIMVLIVDESEDIQESLLSIILSALGRKRTDYSMAARKLAMNVIERCAGKLEPFIKQFLISSLSGDSGYLSDSVDHHEVIFDVYQCAPQMLTKIVPYITGELLTDKPDIRSKAVELLGELFSLPGVPVLESFQPLFSEYLKRLADRVVEVRVSVIGHLKTCLMSNPSRPEAPRIIKALCERLLDYDENVRKQVVAAVYDVACHSLDAIPIETVRLVAERLRDKSLSVKKYTMERLADLYRLYCQKSSDGTISSDNFEWIPGKILKCLYDKDFRPETIEHLLCGSLFPPEFSIKDRVKHWITAFSGFDKVEVKALEQILLQKQRLQQEMQKYLSLRQTYQQEDAPDLQKRISGCFRNMSRLFNDPAKAEESLNMLNQLKDANIWKILTSLLDFSTMFSQAWSSREELLKILGEKHPLYDFMSTLSIRCSYLLINKEFVKEILSQAAELKSAGNTRLISSCMDLLTVIAGFFPLLLVGLEEDLVHLLKEDNEALKEGIAHVLAKAGGTIREQLAMTKSSIDLLLERLCLEGTRKQAKYSVHALAAITKDDGLKSLSVLYKRLVDMLEEKTHLPAMLQSLGCIAQTAMPIFETREDEIVGFIINKILQCSNKADEVSIPKTEWNERTEFCSLKIYGIKTLVKSYLLSKDAHLRPGIEKLMGILKNILSFGDISRETGLSAVDKAHLRLAAAKAVLRLSKQWDQKIPVDVFYMTLRVSQDDCPESRKLYLNKVHQYIKERLLDPKYACAFMLSIKDCQSPEYEECKHNLLEVVQICQQVKVRQLSVQADMNLLVAYPEYILAYLVHALAHDPSCPNVEDCQDLQAFEPTYWRLHLFLSAVLLGDEGLQPGGVSNSKQESFITIASIFHSIKCSEDLVDGKKSKTLHAISDLGLSIAKKLVPDQTDVPGSDMVPLPAPLYMNVEKNQDENTVDKSEETLLDLGGESALAHFESLHVESKETVDSGDVKDEMVVQESDENGNEVPLGKMMKLLRSQGAKKKKKATKKQNLSSDVFDFENEVDVLGVIREINMDNLENSETMKVSRDNKGGKALDSRKRKIEKASIAAATPTPKRKRSASSQKVMKGKDMVQSTDSDLLISCLPTNTKNGKKHADELHTEGAISSDSKKSTTPEDAKKLAGQSGNSTGSVKKRKIRSISGLAKCSHSNELDDEEIVGSRIKVWWPLDKQFYEGIVQSYDAKKEKHVILYDDGDIEVLNLAKEKWEVISNNGHLPKKMKKSNHLSTNKKSSDEKREDDSKHGDLRQSKKSTKKSASSKSKDTVGKHKDHDRKRTSKGSKKSEHLDADNRADSNLPNAHSHSGSEVEDANSDGHEEDEAPTSPLMEEPEAGLEEGKEELGKEQKPDSLNGEDNEESDDEPISAWRSRVAKVT